MKIKISTPVGISETGGRAKQEDSIYPALSDLTQESQVMVVCDGLGGLELGEVASDTVSRALGQWVEKNVSVDATLSTSTAIDAVDEAQLQLNRAAARFDTVHSMGTTLAMIVLGSNGVVAAHIGDSRIYHIRPAEKKILYRSRDHSLVNDLFQMGRLSRLEAEVSPKKNILTRAMRPAPASAFLPDVALITDIKAGDYFMLCTDGLTAEVSDKKLVDLLARTDMGEAMKVAAMQVMAKDGDDNRSVVLVRVEQVEHEPGELLLNANEAAMCDKMVMMDVVPESEAWVPKHPIATPASAPAVDVAEPPAVPLPAVEENGVTAAVPPAIPAAAQGADVDRNPLPPTEYVTGHEEEHYDYSKPKKKDYTALRRAGIILLLGLLLAGGITTYFALNKKKNAITAQPVVDTIADPDVSIDSMLPEMPVDSLAVGSNVAVPRAPGIGNVPLPNTEAPAPAAASSGSYPKGSNVAVPKAPRYNGNNTPPYDPYDGSGGFGSDEPIPDEDDAPKAPDVSQRRSTSEPPATADKSPVTAPASNNSRPQGQVPPAVPQGGKRSKSDPGAVVGGAVPPPPGRINKVPETP